MSRKKWQKQTEIFSSPETDSDVKWGPRWGGLATPFLTPSSASLFTLFIGRLFSCEARDADLICILQLSKAGGSHSPRAHFSDRPAKVSVPTLIGLLGSMTFHATLPRRMDSSGWPGLGHVTTCRVDYLS